jgi:hypothetical protein
MFDHQMGKQILAGTDHRANKKLSVIGCTFAADPEHRRGTSR